MKLVSLIYSGIFSLLWLFNIREYLSEKERWWVILISIISGIIMITGIVLYWPAEPPEIVQDRWQYFFYFLILSELGIVVYEAETIERRIPKDLEGEIDDPKGMVIPSMILSALFLIPGLYFNYKVAFFE